VSDVWHAGWRTSIAPRWIEASFLALLIAAPILMTLKGSVGQHVAPLVLRVSSAGTLRNGAVFTSLFGDEQWARLLDTPAVLVFQFGMVGVLGTLGVVRRFREGRWDDLARGHAASAIAVLTLLVLLRPPVGMDNNLGFRPMLLVWSLLVPFAAEAW